MGPKNVFCFLYPSVIARLLSLRSRADEEPGHCNVNLLQSGLLHLYYILRGLKARRYRLVYEDDEGGSQLSVHMEENLRLAYLGKVELVGEVEIGGCEVLVCKNPRNKGVIRQRVH